MTQFLIVLAWLFVFLVLPFLLGFGICRALRTREYGMRLSWVLFSIFLAFSPFAAKIVQTERFAYQLPSGKYVSAAKVKEVTDPQTGRLKKVEADTDAELQIVPLGGKDIELVDGKWLLATDRTVEVVHQTTFDLSRWSQALSYGIDLAGGTNLVYEVDLKKAEADGISVDSDLMGRLVGAVARRVNPSGTKEIVVRRLGQSRIEIILPGADPAIVEQTKHQITLLGSLEFSIVANQIDHSDIIKRAMAAPGIIEVRSADAVVAKWRPIAPNKDPQGHDVPNMDFENDPDIALRQIPGKRPGFKEILILNSEKPITGKYLRRANPTSDQTGRPAVGFHFDTAGGFLFNDLTTKYSPRKDGTTRRLAVMLNGEVVTAPSIRTAIGQDGIIEGRFTPKEVNDQVAVLNAGALPVPIKQTPISEFTISPTLGSDVQSKGVLALWISSIAVVIFMAGYYFTAGLVANLALLLNLLFIVALMAFVKAAITLPGLAGLVLSAGMAVDANVLIYERIREELHRGASLRMAIHNGFHKAFVAIFDSHITSLITAIILYVVGTETVKGFAVALFIGLVMNLYTAVYISRIVMNILERSRVVTKLRMLSMIGVTNFDFVGKQVAASIASLILIAVGLVAFVMRGEANYDIDFTGGTSVTMQFNEPQTADFVREQLGKAFGSNITVEELSSSGQITKGTYFRLRVANDGSTEIDPALVERRVNEAFPDKLVHKLLVAGEITPIAATPAKPAEGSEATPEAPAVQVERFAGGREVTISFVDDRSKPVEIAPATFARLFEKQLAGFGPAEKRKYSDPENLYFLEGSAGRGLAAREGQVRLFTSLKLKTSPTVDEADLKTALAGIARSLEEVPAFDEVTRFESSVAKETKQSALFAVIASLLAIVAYIWFRFENPIFGIAAVIALAHDVLVTLGMVALCSYLAPTVIGPIFMLTDFKINMAMIAAFLTIVGYSVNDTIVIFDRLREIRGKNPVVTRDMLNLTVNQTLSRTILTAFTVLLSVLILYIVGGEGIHGFAFCMVVGAIAGTYSTVYIASPLVLKFMDRFTHKTDTRKTPARSEAAA